MKDMKLKDYGIKWNLNLLTVDQAKLTESGFCSCNRNYILQTGSAWALVSLDLRKAVNVMSHMENFHQDGVRWNS